MWMLGGMLDDMPDDGRDERAHPELAAALERELVVKRGKPMFGSMETRPIDTTGMSAFSATKALEAIRVWVINDAVEDGQPVVTGMAFRYRGDEAFQPAAAPDADHDARLRSRDPFVFEADELVLAPGERVTRVVWTYGEPEFVCEMEFTTSLGRVKTFGGRSSMGLGHGISFDHSNGGAALCGFVGYRDVIDPYYTMEMMFNGPVDVHGGAVFFPQAVYFDNAWNRRNGLVLVHALYKKGRAAPNDKLWQKVVALPPGAWRNLVCLL
mmetsp:Transcript_4161/g.12260  ORF Transcript_4161/g.12260 Transcript_4161/m.12260 type:complete len:268 (+) Transcript_4161:529-1332(+)